MQLHFLTCMFQELADHALLGSNGAFLKVKRRSAEQYVTCKMSPHQPRLKMYVKFFVKHVSCQESIT